MTLPADQRRKVNAELAAQFMRREIDWQTVLAVWEPEPHEPPEPLDVEAELDRLRSAIVMLDLHIASGRKAMADSEELRKEIERLWREQPEKEKALSQLLSKVCEARRLAVERLPPLEKLKEECIALGSDIEGRKGADGAGSSESA